MPGEGALTGLWRDATSGSAGVRLTPGMSDAEIDSAEAAYSVAFPPDLRTCLQAAVPVSAYDESRPELRAKFPNWRDLSNPGIVLRLSWPWEGIVFDLEHNPERWLPDWGERPKILSERIRVVREKYEAAPRLIPVFSHRYIPAAPHESGNPVFSVYQMDIIHYGSDLEDYLRAEFLASAQAPTQEPKQIAFWSRLVEFNNQGYA
jgi:hypothetical protein